jgi:peptidoglycan/xylan/chitin deacetylase (PgdA/CDA1 family)
MTRKIPDKKIILGISLGILMTIIGLIMFLDKSRNLKTIPKDKFGQISNIPTPTPTPTPKPLTFAEMNTLYGPCVRMPVLMYHHVQTEESAKANKQTGLTVYTDIFQKQMQYLKDKGYNVVGMNDLINFFDNATPVTPKSVLITFDDGYADFNTDAFPILQSFGYKATVFVSTGLVNNPGYFTWDQILSMGSILFANHTWSHKNVGVSENVMQYEISTADTQLSDRSLNSPKVFGYPYGLETNQSEKYLESLGYKAAFTTIPGNILCKKQRFSLPRIRIGSTSLSNYGF